MEHPLISNIDELTIEDLSGKISELNKKLSIAYRLGNHDLMRQLQMALETYNTKYQEKMKASKSGTDYDGMIDIS